MNEERPKLKDADNPLGRTDPNKVCTYEVFRDKGRKSFGFYHGTTRDIDRLLNLKFPKEKKFRYSAIDVITVNQGVVSQYAERLEKAEALSKQLAEVKELLK